MMNMDHTARLQKRDTAQQSDFEAISLPDSIPNVPGQISPGESRFLYWLVSETYRGWGPIVEIGTWLGRSTVHLAAGLRDSGIPGKIYSYDLFIWGGKGDNRKSGLNLESRSDFMPYFLNNIEAFKDYIVPEKADFSQIRWLGGPIEILFLDAPKSARHFHAAMLNFTDDLHPGDSMLVMQDYQHPLSYELPLMVWGLQDFLRLTHAVSSGGTASFGIRQPLSPQALQEAFNRMEEMTESTASRAWEEILEPLGEPIRNRMLLASSLHLYSIGAKDRALEAFEAIRLDNRMRQGLISWSKIEKLKDKFAGIFEALARRSVD